MKKLLTLAAAAMMAATSPASAQNGPGVTDTEIKIGMTAPLSGPASIFGVLCTGTEAYFNMINDKGGVNGRNLVLLCEDDAYSPPKGLEQTRKLIERDGVFFIFGSAGTGVNSAIKPYLESRNVPQILIQTGSSNWSDPATSPWTLAGLATYSGETGVFANYIMENLPDAKVGMLHQNDDYGKDFLHGLLDGFGDKQDDFMVGIETNEITDPTVDSQLLSLKNAGADVVVIAALDKHTAQAIRKIAELDWKPTIMIVSPASSVTNVLERAGVENSVGVITAATIKNLDDSKWDEDQDVQEYKTFMEEYYPDGDVSFNANVYSYTKGFILVDILTRAGDELTRENIMRLARTTDVHPPLYLPSIDFRTTPDSGVPVHSYQLLQFDGEKYVEMGEPVSID